MRSSLAASLCAFASKLARHRRGFQRQLVVFAAFLMLASCASPSRVQHHPKPIMPAYTMRAHLMEEAAWDANGYQALLNFEIRSDQFPPWRHVVQEIEHISTYRLYSGQVVHSRVTLVEVFELEIYQEGAGWLATLPAKQRDRHYESGFLHVEDDVESLTIERRVRAYPASVEGADFTSLGFAHLPSNARNDFKTQVPVNFNRTYQSMHETTGRVLWDDRRSRPYDYQMRYEWTKEEGRQPLAHFQVHLPGSMRETAAGGVGEKAP